MTKDKKPIGGRPEKITPEKLDHFKTFIIAGCTLKEACEQIEISTTTWHNYCKKHPSILPKFAKWKKELKTRAKLNIAMNITNNKDIDSSIYYLEQQQKLKDQAARTAVNRAKAKQIKIQTKLLERQLEQINDTADSVRDSMAQLDVETLKKLAHLDDGIDINASDK